MSGHFSPPDSAEPIELAYTRQDAPDLPVHDTESRKSVFTQNDQTPLLIQGDAGHATSAKPRKPASSFQARLIVGIDNTIRILGLHIIVSAYQALSQTKRREGKRVAIIVNRPAVVLASLLHVLPIGGCIVLIGLTRNGYYIGGELSGAVDKDALKFLGLQLAAKLHEITMVASLAEMVFSSVRREIKAGRPVPFAALAAGMQFDSISYLWSKEYLAICIHAFTRNLRILPIAALIIVCSVLGVTVAPASATAMQPVLDYWPAGGTDVWLNGSIGGLYPVILDASHVGAADCGIIGRNNLCPSVGWETLGTKMLSYFPQLQSSPDGLGVRYPDTLQVTARSATLTLYLDVRQPAFDRYTFNYTVSTMQHAVMAEALAQNTRL